MDGLLSNALLASGTVRPGFGSLMTMSMASIHSASHQCCQLQDTTLPWASKAKLGVPLTCALDPVCLLATRLVQQSR